MVINQTFYKTKVFKKNCISYVDTQLTIRVSNCWSYDGGKIIKTLIFLNWLHFNRAIEKKGTGANGRWVGEIFRAHNAAAKGLNVLVLENERMEEFEKEWWYERDGGIPRHKTTHTQVVHSPWDRD